MQHEYSETPAIAFQEAELCLNNEGCCHLNLSNFPQSTNLADFFLRMMAFKGYPSSLIKSGSVEIEVEEDKRIFLYNKDKYVEYATNRSSFFDQLDMNIFLIQPKKLTVEEKAIFNWIKEQKQKRPDRFWYKSEYDLLKFISYYYPEGSSVMDKMVQLGLCERNKRKYTFSLTTKMISKLVSTTDKDQSVDVFINTFSNSLIQEEVNIVA